MAEPEPSSEATDVLARLRAGATSETAFVVGGLLVAEAMLLIGYFGLSSTSVTAVRYALYPFVWIDVAVLAVWKTRPPTAATKRRLAAGAVAAGYLLVLSVAGGVIATPAGGPSGLSILGGGSPGYAPTVTAGTVLFDLILVPYKVVGYLALAYLVYATVLDAAGSAITGIVGVFSCVSCTWPVVASVATGILGAIGGPAAATAASLVTAYALDISAVVFVTAVALLYWRPGFGG